LSKWLRNSLTIFGIVLAVSLKAQVTDTSTTITETDTNAVDTSDANYAMCVFFEDKNIYFDSCTFEPLYHLTYSWLSVPYHYAGNSKKGVDCSGLVKMFYKELYDIALQGGSRHIYPLTKEVPIDALQQGDLVFFKIRGDKISHVGIYLKDGYFVHASTKLGVTVSNLSEPYYNARFYKGGMICLPK